MTSPRYRVIVLTLAALAAAGCTGEPEPVGDPPDTPGTGARPAETTPEPTADLLAAWRVPSDSTRQDYAFPLPEEQEVGVAVEHPAGVTLELHRVAFLADRIELQAVVVNDHVQGRDIELAGGPGLPGTGRSLVLEDDLGNRYPYSPAFEDDRLAVAAGTAVEARTVFFGAVRPGASELRLLTNAAYAGQSQAEGGVTQFPVMRATVPVAWPDDAPADGEVAGVQAAHVNRTLLRATSVTLETDHTVVEVEAVSRLFIDRPVALAERDIVLRDDLGHVHTLIPPDDDPRIRLEPATAYEGRWVFAGGVHPDATEITVVTNAAYEGSRPGEDARTTTPTLVLEAIPLPEREPDATRQSTHPLGLHLRVTGVAVYEDRVEVDVVAVNGSSRAYRLNESGVGLVDDSGTRYDIAAPGDEPHLEVPARTTLEAVWVFPGRFSTAPGALTLVTNDGGSGQEGSAEAIATTRPLLEVDDIPVSVPAHDDVPAGGPPRTAQEARARDLERSTMSAGEALVTTAEQVERILADFDAEAIDEGILITFPDDVLFEFDRADITQRGGRVLADMYEVISYYADAPVRIEGHTDGIGTPEYNQGLSERRANAVHNHLVEVHGVDAGRLTARGFGLTRPVAPNTHSDGSDNPEGRTLNRRVEVVIETEDRSLLPQDD